MDWVAHSFLAPIELFSDRREVRPVTGFSWGFQIDRTRAIAVRPIHPLGPADWEQHREYLSRSFPEWSFLTAEMPDAHLDPPRG